ncbi:hypothetical protein DFH09DRAFT_1151368 [Mycena vulgaris]|nr:hypothetical protein DFH09DRAFT_1159869 [Mycena vulgaris]KAJ6573901.1 hypothetical protein DFH09DRAFT_1151368 [Mycena vulgaris]
MNIALAASSGPSSLKRPIEHDTTTAEHAFPRKRQKSPTGPVLQYAHYLTDDQKSRTVRYMLKNSLIHPSLVSASALATVARDHDVPRKKRALLIADLQTHSCIWSCRVRSADARDAGQLLVDADSVEPLNRSKDLLPRGNDARSPARNCQREQAVLRRSQAMETDQDEWARKWPQLESEESLNQVRRPHSSHCCVVYAVARS